MPLVFSYIFNFLYFLLCGISFRKNKILWAFIILFGSSIVLSTVMTTMGLQTNYDVDDLAEAEVIIRAVVRWSTVFTGLLAAGIAGGIFLRIKTLKH